MSTSFSNAGSGSIISSRSAFTHAGSPRPTRPGQLDQAIAENIAGGVDPEALSEIAHASAWALLSRVHESDDPVVVERVLTLVDHEGVDVIAQLWSHSEPDSLPGVLWRLYIFRTWMQKHRDNIAKLWRMGEPVATSASAIAGVDTAPSAQDIARTADSILAGAFTGDFAVALERAAAFIDIIALGMRVEVHRGQEYINGLTDISEAKRLRTQNARLLHNAANLRVTARDLAEGAHLWRRGKLE